MNFLELAKSQPIKNKKLKTNRIRKSYLSPDQVESIKKDYSEAILTIDEIVKKYDTSKGKIWRITKEYNLTNRSSGRRRAKSTPIQHDYFEEINTKDKAYHLGFITADGHIEKERIRDDSLRKSATLKFQIAKKDIEILEKFKYFCKSEHTITYKTIFNPKIQKEPTEGCYLKIGCLKMCQDLEKHGVTNKKSSCCKIPTTIPNHLMPHYIRGLIDGDGGWTFYKRGGNYEDQLTLHFCSSLESFINEVQDILVRECELDNKTVCSPNKKGTYFQFRYGGNQQCLKIFNYLYGDGGPWLERKYLKAKEHLEKIGLLYSNYKKNVTV